MELFDIAETESVVRHIREAAVRGNLSHALLLSGAGDRVAAARFAAAAMECTAERAQPCGVCNACRKVREGIHPDVITVQDPEHKNIAIEIVRSVRSDAYVRPNEGKRKVYIFPDCALLTEADQNVLLKVVEEGPPYAAFLFCAENPSQVLQTLRSRCVELKLQPLSAAAAVESEAGEQLCQTIAEKKRGSLAALAARFEKRKMTREELAFMLDWSRGAFAAALLLLYGQEDSGNYREIAPFLAKNLTKTQIMSTIELLQMYHRECNYNIGPGHVLGALAAELEGIL